MSSFGPMPELGNLAWAPLASADQVVIFDRFNGVPTLGVVRSGSESDIFWRAAFYLSDISLWLYVPLTEEDLRVLFDDDEDQSLLDGRVFNGTEARYATAAVAFKNRVVFEREWRIEPGQSGEEINSALTEFVSDALKVALKQDPPLPPTRRDIVQRASEVVRQLAPC